MYDDLLVWNNEALVRKYHVRCTFTLCSVPPMIVSEELFLLRFTATWSYCLYYLKIDGLWQVMSRASWYMLRLKGVLCSTGKRDGDTAFLCVRVLEYINT